MDGRFRFPFLRLCTRHFADDPAARNKPAGGLLDLAKHLF